MYMLTLLSLPHNFILACVLVIPEAHKVPCKGATKILWKSHLIKHIQLIECIQCCAIINDYTIATTNLVL